MAENYRVREWDKMHSRIQYSNLQSIKLILKWNEVKTRLLTLLSSRQIPPRIPVPWIFSFPGLRNQSDFYLEETHTIDVLKNTNANSMKPLNIEPTYIESLCIAIKLEI